MATKVYGLWNTYALWAIAPGPQRPQRAGPALPGADPSKPGDATTDDLARQPSTGLGHRPPALGVVDQQIAEIRVGALQLDDAVAERARSPSITRRRRPSRVGGDPVLMGHGVVGPAISVDMHGPITKVAGSPGSTWKAPPMLLTPPRPCIRPSSPKVRWDSTPAGHGPRPPR